MSKWSVFTLFLCASLLSSTLFGQWAPAGAQYPQSQYPPQQQSAPYPQSQYPPVQNQQQLPPQQAAESPDPADLQHGAARLSIVQGDVNIRRGDNGQLTGAVVNAPLVGHDHVETSNGSRAEVQLDAVTLLRLAPNTDIGFADLQYHRAQIQLGLGTIIFRVLQASPTQVEIDTPSVGFRALSAGEYRISVFENGTSQISVRNGQAEVLAPRGSEQLQAGRSVMVRGDASNPEMQDATDVARDQFDDWSARRDQESAASQSTQYVNTDVQGASDLDRYGSWVPSPDYGQVWQPQGVPQDWSPYSNGQWAYTDYYGWSWIDASPWGWAPYHYGRWFYNTGYGWCWWPGARLHPAYYSPALVGFYGLGRGIGIGLEGLAWVALAPFEIFHPWWGVHAGFGFGGGYGFRGGYGFGGYRNAGFRGGVLVASVNSFAGVRQRFGVASRSQLAGASAISGRLPVNNFRAGMNYSSRAAVPNARFASVQSRTFYNSGQNRSFAGSANSSYRSFSTPRASTPASGSGGGWQHFGTPGTSAPRSNFQSSEPSGWHSFGTPATSGGYRAAPQQASPSYQQRNNYSAPRSYSQPGYQQQQPRSNYSVPRQNYSAPRSNPQPRTSAPSAPHSSGGGGHSSGGGGGGHHGR
jgi:ferric-dicitrate binding protein FerR (iron transport regulator)